MNDRIKLILIVFVTALVLVGSSFLYHSLKKENIAPTPDEIQIPNGETGSPDGKFFSDFTVSDEDGNEVKLSQFIGKPIVLNFWASWCGPCKNEMSDFNDAYLEYADQVQFLMINLTDGSRETVSSASNYVLEQDYTFPVFYDTESFASSAYRVSSIPQSYFIDASGYIIHDVKGTLSYDKLISYIETILK